MRKKTKQKIGLLIATALAFAFWRYYVNVVPHEPVPNPVMPNPNAYDYYVEASKELKGTAPFGNIPEQDKPRREWKKSYPKAVKEKWVRDNAKSLNLVRKAKGYPCRAISMRTLEDGIKWKPFDLARALCVEAEMHGDRGHWEKAAQSAMDSLEMGYAIRRGGNHLDRLRGYSCAAIGNKTMQDIVPHLDSAECLRIIKRLEKLIQEGTPLEETLREEKYYQQAVALNFMKSPVWFALNFDGTSDDPAYKILGTIIRTWCKPKRQTYRYIAQYMDDLSTQAALPYQQRRLPTITEAYGRFWFLYDRVFFSDARSQTSDALLLAQLALQGYRMKHGNYPDTLQKLTPDYLKKVPTDPFGKGELLHYRLANGGKEFLLYSVGPDGKDDLGQKIVRKVRSNRTSYSVIENSKGDFVSGVNY